MTAPAQIKNISFAGAGNLATHLSAAFLQKGISIRSIYSPTVAHAETLAQKISAKVVTDIRQLADEADLIFLCVKDDALPEVSAQLSSVDIPLVHTSGSVSIDVLANHPQPYGVFYPVQSFRPDRPVQWNEIPVCIESNDAGFLASLSQLAGMLSEKVVTLDSRQRAWLHLSAVMVSNFSNLLYIRAEKILQEKNLDFSLLHSLISETALRLQNASPHDMQTGPAKRNDQHVISTHEQMLQNEPEMLELYRLMTGMIRKEFK